MAWTKAKITVAVGAAVILVAGTATVLIKNLPQPHAYDPWENIGSAASAASDIIQKQDEKAGQARNSLSTSAMMKQNEEINGVYADYFKKAPTGVMIRQTSYNDREGGCVLYGENQIIETAVPVSRLLAIAYGTNHQDFSTARIILPANLPDAKFDYLINVPDHGREYFLAQIQKQFGLTGRFETRETNVIALVVKNRAAAALRPGAPPPALDGTMGYLNTSTAFALADRLERTFFHQPVVDETRLRGNFWSILPWHPEDLDLLTNKLHETGLELIPTNMPVEMLVVEKVK